MNGFLLKWFANTITLMVVVAVVPGIHAEHWETIAVAALILGLLNAFIKPALIILTLPLQVMSLGFFTLVINGAMLYLISKIIDGFYMASFWSAFWGAILFSIVNFFLNLFIDPAGRVNVHYQEFPSQSRPEDSDFIDIEGHAEEDNHNKRIT